MLRELNDRSEALKQLQTIEKVNITVCDSCKNVVNVKKEKDQILEVHLSKKGIYGLQQIIDEACQIEEKSPSFCDKCQLPELNASISKCLEENQQVDCNIATLERLANLTDASKRDELNDVLIEKYFSLIEERSKEDPNLPKVKYFDSLTIEKAKKYSSPMQAAQDPALLKDIDLSKYNKILVPLHDIDSNHWTLLEIDYSKHHIVVHNSIDGLMSTRTKGDLQLWQDILEADFELKNMNNSEFESAKEFTHSFSKSSPQQKDGVSCGVYTCVGKLSGCLYSLLHIIIGSSNEGVSSKVHSSYIVGSRLL